MLLDVAGLSIDLPTSEGARRIVNDISFTLGVGDTLGIVGESGSGKTMTALALMGLLPDGAIVSGSALFEGKDLAKLGEPEMRDLRGDRIAMIFQEPMTALNPLHSIGRQIAEPLILHRDLSKREAHAEAVRLLGRVGLPEPERRARAYPHELSGGQRQRAMIAMALSCEPRLIIADEPTTALDVTVQAQILDLIAELGAKSETALILVSHDLAVIAQNCARVLVMYGGVIMESGRTDEVLERSAHPYTKALLGARPRVGARRGERLSAIPGGARAPGTAPGCPFAGRCPLTIAACSDTLPAPVALSDNRFARCIRLDAAERGMSDAPLLEIVELVKVYAQPRTTLFGPRPRLRAVDGVSFSLAAGRSFGVVGESGSGKSTLARAAMALERPTSGEARLMGASLTRASRAALRKMRAQMQMIFQDPYGSLDPRQTVARIVAEPLACLDGISRAERGARVADSLEAVGLSSKDGRKYPHEFSGGQRQRIAIARALITRPHLVVADEPVSALDVSIQAQVLNLMTDLQRQLGVTYLLISHDLAVVEHICEEIAVMYRGRFVETGPSDALLVSPAHPYTRALVNAAPKLHAERRRAAAPADAWAPAEGGCPYAARCALAQDRCRKEPPSLRPLADGRRVACHFPL